MRTPILRPYDEKDLSSCLAIFDGNVPAFFAADERAEFQKHLESADRAAAPYIVLEDVTGIVACGGLSIDASRKTAALSWGMVERSLQGQGLGRLLTETRLALARSIPGIMQVDLSTSQHTSGFYEAFGFTVIRAVPCGFGPGLDRLEMALRL
ncbi:GNAT family N-acetyltransferase [Paracoccus sp. DK608]|uniref:GNAT family N-acetyltransferase n=2 Tax=Paracoccus shanxieyensis TaxID=2675752 RepID=A0A6L6J4J7_9RHOB|nr:GNAT family N-acetyltransferase [Paracoccus shanxieyensis]MTH88781.1 GNAT family N-acetyltransferase [Paracoccus shanxieyensis]